MFFIDAFDFFMPFFSGINIVYKGLYVISFLPITALTFYMLFIEDEEKMLPDMICSSLLLVYLFPLTVTIFALVFFAGIIYSIWQSITISIFLLQKAAYKKDKKQKTEIRKMKR